METIPLAVELLYQLSTTSTPVSTPLPPGAPPPAATVPLENLSQTELIALVRRLLPAEPVDQPSKRKAKARKSARPIQYLDDAELDRLFRAVRAARSVRDLAIFEVAYHRGLRASEVGRLMLDDLHLDRQTLFVRALKGGTSGEALLTHRELKALRAWLRIRGSVAGALFPSRKQIMGPGGLLKGIERTQLHRLMHRYGAVADLPVTNRHFHCLRHSCATQLFDRDVDIREIQIALRHRDIRNTAIYAAVTDKKRIRTAARLFDSW
jgi:type 1 fimbriae regulatory protein FimB